ncbi:hypothetical protein VN97_g4746 [Penicillium thymicola]|uniref:Uncharacterized protein n=1 Tax=Penicillium thymicola TaxID=293382 RepID=A0AAI9TK21_PENTH|nr:hypothetical protein VN97_g4746 [Penicillium thymicola]
MTGILYKLHLTKKTKKKITQSGLHLNKSKKMDSRGIEPRTTPMLREYYTTKPQAQLDERDRPLMLCKPRRHLQEFYPQLPMRYSYSNSCVHNVKRQRTHTQKALVNYKKAGTVVSPMQGEADPDVAVRYCLRTRNNYS